MSLARAFTTRRAKVFGGEGDGKPTRSGTVRSKISAPMGLVSTTNMLSYNAPDIRKGPKISAPVELTFTTNALSYDAPDIHREPKTATSNSSMSLQSDGDSDHIHTAASSPPTSPDTAFPRGVDEDLNKSSTSTPEPNHLSCYFTLPGEPSNVGAPAVPSLPKRAPSHANRQHVPLSPKSSMSERLNRKISISERLGRQPSVSRLSEHSNRSVSTKTSGQFSRVSSASTSTTASSHSIGAQHLPKTSSQAPPPVPVVMPLPQQKEFAETMEPFGQELAQVTELAEEYANSAAEKTRRIDTQEERELADRGLQKFSPEEYIADISNLLSSFFGEARHAKIPAPQWI
ncbi:hypothetical protein N0V93_003392 [Gnomoniopsis smithogilvyi]|uniref:Uncharacterized protein n=1 Tax=Gnomoniopsis smithogilvyi TaxID=1191159 RepID=A0A9W8Z0N2_9PEZI|nr:hypothetical protein N0V93_003392 [Gnomoniopsis smithogilvyi]